jgi:hypothetical protein
LLALLDLASDQPWREASQPLRGITPIIEFVSEAYGVRYAPSTRETVRDEAVKHFFESGLVIRNSDDPARPTDSGNIVYQMEPQPLGLLRILGGTALTALLAAHMASRETIRRNLHRTRSLARIPIRFPSGKKVRLSPGGQNPLIKAVIEQFCPRFVPGGTVVYVGDAENKFMHLEVDYLKGLGVEVPAPAKMPDVVVHDLRRGWLLLIEAVTIAGPVDAKRRKELKSMFAGSKTGLVFVTAFPNRKVMRSFLTQISWETVAWMAKEPGHLIHFNGEKLLGPYSDAP